MAWTTITHSCSHIAEHNLLGTNSHGERDRKAAWLATVPCRDCNAVKAAEQRASDIGRLVDIAALPALDGSPNQVEWATRLRITAVGRVVEIITRLSRVALLQRSVELGENVTGQDWDELTDDARDDAARLVIESITAITDARWWIDNRHAPYAAALSRTDRSRLAAIRAAGRPTRHAPTAVFVAPAPATTTPPTRRARTKPAQPAAGSFRAARVNDTVIVYHGVGTPADPYRLVSVRDTSSTTPARRIVAGGQIQPLGESTLGLTVYGTHRFDRPSFDAAARLAGNLIPLLTAVSEGRAVAVS